LVKLLEGTFSQLRAKNKRFSDFSCKIPIQPTFAPLFSDMKRILVIGAGRSSANLIKYLTEHASAEDWMIRVGDMDVEFARKKIGACDRAHAFELNASDTGQRRKEIEGSDLVISMLPAAMHMLVARDCLDLGKNVITPSYIPDEMWTLDQEAKAKGILILNEMGVDPGIDHMSAMKIIHELQAAGAALDSFESFTGGLIAPESDNNPWNYKITWNPRNVVLAGYGGTARYRWNHSLKYIPYHRLFERITPVDIDGYGRFEGYANRDSLKYTRLYGLDTIPTLFRGTLRRGGFCAAWNALVQLGLTDDSFQIENAGGLTWRRLTASFINESDQGNLEKEIALYTGANEDTMAKLKWLGIFDDAPLGISEGSPAVALQKLIENKWKLDDHDKDMIVMWHRFYYRQDNTHYELQSSLITLGDDQVHTAMSKTVGLPIAIAARMILNGSMKLTGVQLPVIPEIYNPVLQELESFGISFKEKKSVLQR
jgi:saccharopine dehydrogenase (NAD+, L-glutamate forming)